MDMMQNLCQKHALNHPYVVSRRKDNEKPFTTENLSFMGKFNLWFPPSLYAPITCAEEGGDFFYLARGSTKP